MGAAPNLKYTTDEYLQLEAKATNKHEFYRGEIFAMAGASIQHNQVASNTHIEIGSFLKDKTCTIFPSDLKIHVAANSLFTYPDLSIVCGTIETLENHKDVVTNPVVLIEVLSESTQDYDRGGKYKLYRDIPSLQEYILISSTEILVEKYTKQTDASWLLQEYKSLQDSFTISAISFNVLVESLYKNVGL